MSNETQPTDLQLAEWFSLRVATTFCFTQGRWWRYRPPIMDNFSDILRVTAAEVEVAAQEFLEAQDDVELTSALISRVVRLSRAKLPYLSIMERARAIAPAKTALTEDAANVQSRARASIQFTQERLAALTE